VVTTKSLKVGLSNSSIARLNCFAICQLTIQFAVGVGLLWWIVDWFTLNETHFIQAFGQASSLLLSLAVSCFALSNILKSVQCLVLLSPPVSSGYMAGVILSQNALLTFLPWRMGEIRFPILLRQDHNIPISKSVSSLIAIRSLDLLVVVIVATIGSQKLGFQISLSNIFLAIGIVVTLVGAFDFALRRLRGRTFLKSLVDLIEPTRNPMRLGSVLVLSIGIFSLSTLQSTFALQALGLAVSLSDVALLNALTLLAALLPIHPPGGWGTIDSIQIAILHHLNYQPEHSVPVVLAAHCFYTLLVLSGGIFGWILRLGSLRQ
jgi:uncharacterized membrane protein YbhN (UPF0104 family)